MPQQPKRIEVAFYQTRSGAAPVREWLDGLTPAERRVIGFDLAKVEFGWPVGMPVCRPLGAGLWEVRSSLPGGKIARVLFCIADDCMVLLHGFIKKTQKTPKADLDKARERQKDVTT